MIKLLSLLRAPVFLILILAGVRAYAAPSQSQADAAGAPVPQPAQLQGQGTPAPGQPVAPMPATGDAVSRVEVVASQFEASRAATTFKQVIGAADLVRFGDASVLDVLRRQPGIVVNGVAGQRGGQISMRGLGSGYVRILLNGEPAPAGFSLDNLVPDLVERIDILAVPTVELGMQAIGGAINIILKRSNAKTRTQFKAGLADVEGQTRPQASGSVGGEGGKWSWLLTGAARGLGSNERIHTHTEGVTAAGPLSRQLEQFNHDDGALWNVAPRITLKLGGDDTLAWQGFFSRNNYDSLGYDHTVYQRGPVSEFADDSYASTGRSTQLRNKLTWLTTLGPASKLEIKLGSTTSHARSASAVDFTGVDGALAHRQHTASADDVRGASAAAKLKTTYAKVHTVIAGIEVETTRADATRVNLVDAASLLDATGSAFKVDTRRSALYLQDEWDVGERWSLYLGMRWERVALVSENNLGSRVDSSRAVLSPVVQTVWRVPGTKSDQVRLGMARTWRLPPTENLIAGRSVSNDNTVTTPDTSGNPQLRAELAWGLDGAYEHYFSKDAVFTATAFLRRIEDVMLTKTRLNNGRWVAMPVNEGDAVSRGIEIELKGKLDQFSSAAPPIDLRAGLARSWSSVDAVPGPDNRIGRQAPLSLNVGADYALKSLPLTTGATLGFVRNGQVRVSPFETVDGSDSRSFEAYALWKVQRSAMLRLSAANVLRRDDIQATRYVQGTQDVQKRVARPSYAVLRAMLELSF